MKALSPAATTVVIIALFAGFIAVAAQPVGGPSTAQLRKEISVRRLTISSITQELSQLERRLDELSALRQTRHRSEDLWQQIPINNPLEGWATWADSDVDASGQQKTFPIPLRNLIVEIEVYTLSTAEFSKLADRNLSADEIRTHLSKANASGAITSFQNLATSFAADHDGWHAIRLAAGSGHLLPSPYPDPESRKWMIAKEEAPKPFGTELTNYVLPQMIEYHTSGLSADLKISPHSDSEHEYSVEVYLVDRNLLPGSHTAPILSLNRNKAPEELLNYSLSFEFDRSELQLDAKLIAGTNRWYLIGVGTAPEPATTSTEAAWLRISSPTN